MGGWKQKTARIAGGLDFEIHNAVIVQVVDNRIKQAMRQLAIFTLRDASKPLKTLDHLPLHIASLRRPPDDGMGGLC